MSGAGAKLRKLLVATFCCFIAGSTLAGNAFIGGSWGKASYTIEGPDSATDTQDSGFKLYAGYRVMRWLGVEAAYTDLLTGKEAAVGTDFSVAVKYSSVAAVGLLPLHPRFELWGKVGFARSSTDVSIDDGVSPPFNDSASDTGVGFGLGFDWYAVRRLGFRVELESFDFGAVTDIRYLSAGLIYRFGKH